MKSESTSEKASPFFRVAYPWGCPDRDRQREVIPSNPVLTPILDGKTIKGEPASRLSTAGVCQQLRLMSWGRATEDVRLQRSSDGLIDTLQTGVGEQSQGSSKLYSLEIMRTRFGEREKERKGSGEQNKKETLELSNQSACSPCLCIPREWNLG